MNKFFCVIIFLFLLNNCSFDKNSGIWTGSEQIAKKNNQNDKNLELVFKKQNNILIDKELPPNRNFNLDTPKTFSEWGQSYQNKFNNFGNIKFLNEGNFKKFSKISSAGINKNILVSQDRLFFSDYKGNIGIFSLKQNQLIFKFNFYKKKMKKVKKDIRLILKGDSVIAADNFGYIYSINYKNKKLNWAKNFLVPFRSNLKIINQTLFISDEKNKIILIDTKNGKLIDELYTQPTKTVSKFKSNIAIDNNNNLLFLSTNGTLYSLNLNNQKTINWIQNFKTESEIIFKGNPIIISGDNIIISTEKNISFINRNGARLWDLNIKSNISPVVSGNTIFTVNRDNYLVFINKDTGKIVYSKNLNLLIKNNYNKKFSRKIKTISHIYLADNKLLLISNNSYFIEIEIRKMININSIKKNSFSILSDIIFIEDEMIFVGNSRKIYKVN